MAEMRKQRILVVEDEGVVARELVRVLKAQGIYQVDLEMNGERAAKRIPEEQPDLVLLDLGLPDMDGMDVIREVRGKYSGPIVIVTGRIERDVHALGLRTGGADFLTKPFTTDVLLAHVECRLRERARSESASSSDRPVLELDWKRKIATLNGTDLKLSSTEFELLALLARNPGEVLSREALTRQLSGEVRSTGKALDMALHRLRVKLGQVSNDLLVTIRNKGYRLDPVVLVNKS
jgi:two-component system response regulator RstA